MPLSSLADFFFFLSQLYYAELFTTNPKIFTAWPLFIKVYKFLLSNISLLFILPL